MRPTTAKLSSLAQVSTLLCGLALACLCRPLSVSGLSSECASGVELEVVAFYNAKSGGQKGNKLAATLAEIIGPGFVHDLSELKSAHNICLAISQAQQHWAHPQRPFPKVNSLKSLTRQFILVAGGDGTWQWAQSSLATCKQQSGSSLVHQFPPLAVLPLGTGNDAARVTGWGSTFPLPRALAAVRGTGGRVSRTASLEQQLKQRLCHIASQSRPVNYDVWRVAYTPQGITPSQLKESGSRIPNALQVGAQDRSFLGHMSNYISFGTDATIINRFHTSREERPEYHTGRAANFAQYFFQSAHVALTPSKPVQRKLAVQYRPLNGHWNTLNIPQSHRTILISNLPKSVPHCDAMNHVSIEPRDDSSLSAWNGLTRNSFVRCSADSNGVR